MTQFTEETQSCMSYREHENNDYSENLLECHDFQGNRANLSDLEHLVNLVPHLAQDAPGLQDVLLRYQTQTNK